MPKEAWSIEFQFDKNSESFGYKRHWKLEIETKYFVELKTTFLREAIPGDALDWCYAIGDRLNSHVAESCKFILSALDDSIAYEVTFSHYEFIGKKRKRKWQRTIRP
jgi:hypothetical protein